MLRRLGMFLAFAALATTAAFSQTRSLTNDDVIQMVKAGFDEQTVIKAIQADVPKFDTSVQDLVSLKNAGVPKAVIDAILDREAKASEPGQISSAASQAPDAVPGLPKTSGAYWKTGSGWTALEDAGAPRMKLKGLGKSLVPYVGLFSGPKSEAVYRDPRASVQIPDAKPEFYIRGLSGSTKDVELVQLRVKGKNREIQIGAMKGLRGAEGGYKESDMRKVMVNRISDDVVKVLPTNPLKRGEYLLVDGDRAYDFGIDVKKK